MTHSLVSSLAHLSDRELLERLRLAADHERSSTVHLVALLIEVESRRLYLAEGYSSLFAYCTRVLHLSEHAAYGRIAAARVARRFPLALDLLEAGAITLTTIALLGPHLTSDNHRDLFDRAQHRGRHDVEHLLATLKPREDVPTTVAKLAEALQDVKPLSAERYEIHFTMSAEAHEQLCRVQELMRHSVPDGDVGTIFERAIALLLARVSRIKAATSKRTREYVPGDGTSRYVPAAVRRAVWARDGGRCAFVGAQGRCDERGYLEYHHVTPFALGGKTTVANIELRCHAHNAYEAEEHFGKRESTG